MGNAHNIYMPSLLSNRTLTLQNLVIRRYIEIVYICSRSSIHPVKIDRGVHYRAIGRLKSVGGHMQ